MGSVVTAFVAVALLSHWASAWMVSTTPEPHTTTMESVELQPSGLQPARLQTPQLQTGISFTLSSQRNGSGPWEAKVSGERWTPVAVSGAERCPWTLRVGHEVTNCPLQDRGVRLTATIHKQSNVTDEDLAALAATEIEVPPPTTLYKYQLDNKEYKLDLRLVKWPAARAFCQEEGADLVVPRSGREAQLVVRILHEQGAISEDPYENKQVWVGIHDTDTEGHFQTVHGDSLATVGYAQWALGEPNNLGAGEDCVSMLRNGRYNDEICAKKLAFICERPKYSSMYS